jgi:hypothetical protein
VMVGVSVGAGVQVAGMVGRGLVAAGVFVAAGAEVGPALHALSAASNKAKIERRRIRFISILSCRGEN